MNTVPAESIFARHPSLANAKQPPRTHDRGERFLRKWKHDYRTWRLRVPADSPDGLVGPFQGVGDCLVPYFEPGTRAWIDPTITPRHGDFVCVMWSPAMYQRIVAAAGADFMSSAGRMPSAIAKKRLQRINGEWLLTTVGSNGATAALALEGNARVLGVVRYVEKQGRRVDATPALTAHCIKLEKVTQTHQIGPNSATEIYFEYDAGPTVISALTFDDVLEVTFTAEHAGEVQAICMTNASCSTSANLFERFFLQLGVVSGSSTADTPEGPVGGSPVRVPMQAEILVAAGDSVYCKLYVSAGTGEDWTLTESRLRVEYVKK